MILLTMLAECGGDPLGDIWMTAKTYGEAAADGNMRLVSMCE
jgi:hypothetical protein